MLVDPSATTAAEPGRAAIGLAPGDSLGKYRLERVLGSGGMGIVWAAFDPDLERPVAIKLLHAANTEPKLRTRLLREARAMARLKHPNVLTVYEVGTDRNRDYIAMELVEGESLHGWLQTHPTRDQILDALLAAGSGLAAAHAAGLVHRDFKPHNVLRSSDGHVYVTDFGLARGRIEQATPDAEHLAVPALPDLLAGGSQPRRTLDSGRDAALTQTGVLIGTPAYMAPEQFAGKVPDPRTDQFAFCVTAWEALTGARPFRGATLAELEAATGNGVRKVEAALPHRLRSVLARGLDPDPAARWPDMASLLRALNAARPPSRRRIGLVVGAAAVLVGTIVAYAFESAGDDEACQPADQAFASAWSPRVRAEVVRRHPGGAMIGGAAILDQVRRAWMRSYDRTCAAPPSEERRESLACLHEVRDQVTATTRVLRSSDAAVEVGALVPHLSALGMCDAHAFGELPRSFVPRVPPPPPAMPSLPPPRDG